MADANWFSVVTERALEGFAGEPVTMKEVTTNGVWWAPVSNPTVWNFSTRSMLSSIDKPRPESVDAHHALALRMNEVEPGSRWQPKYWPGVSVRVVKFDGYHVTYRTENGAEHTKPVLAFLNTANKVKPARKVVMLGHECCCGHLVAHHQEIFGLSGGVGRGSCQITKCPCTLLIPKP